MPLDLSTITKKHIGQACALFDSGRMAPARQVHSLVVLVEGRAYPANFLLKVAKGLANGNTAQKSEAINSAQTIKFFNRLGFPIRKGPLQFVNPAGPVTANGIQ